MANDNGAAASTPTPTTASPSPTTGANTPATAVPALDTYSIDDFAAAFKTMEATPDVIRAALHMAGKTAFTKEEAQAIIAKYKSKEVKA